MHACNKTMLHLMHAAVSVNEGWSLGGTSIGSRKSDLSSAAGARAYNMCVHASTSGVVRSLIRGWGVLGWCVLLFHPTTPTLFSH
jgi:hypothetical protein